MVTLFILICSKEIFGCDVRFLWIRFGSVCVYGVSRCGLSYRCDLASLLKSLSYTLLKVLEEYP